MSTQHILLVLTDPSFTRTLDHNVFQPAGYRVTWVDNCHAAENLVGEVQPDLVIMEEHFVDGDYQRLSARLHAGQPALPLILLPSQPDNDWHAKALQAGFDACLTPPTKPEEVLTEVSRVLERRRSWQAWAKAETRRTTDNLRRRVDELEALARVGRSVTAVLDLDQALTTIVEATVDLTGAEEGTLLLVDEASGDLYMRAARNFQEDFVRTFRLPIEDTLAGEVVLTGAPVVVDEGKAKKIATAYLVQSLIYVPIKFGGRVIGVLGVDNRTRGNPFKEQHVLIMSAIADFAAVAIENARLYSKTEIERSKFEAILNQIEDGVIVIDPDGKLLLINRAARRAFNLNTAELVAKEPSETAAHPDLHSILVQIEAGGGLPISVELEDGRTLHAQVTPIAQIGRAITLQDVTHFKELDSLKSEFVSTVSHDLRSPLTAILGYVGLLERIGPINEDQQQFIHRIQNSVNIITNLVDKLLDLGQIEAGFDQQLEEVAVQTILRQSVDGLRHQLNQKDHQIQVDIPPTTPLVRGNPVRLRQMFDNLIDNAIKYTPAGGEIEVSLKTTGGQIIIQIQDTGVGIPPADQAYIFDKLFRASNVPPDAIGSGLGLTIVKSIVESHQGRIWAESRLGQGSTFTVVLPISRGGS